MFDEATYGFRATTLDCDMIPGTIQLANYVTSNFVISYETQHRDEPSFTVSTRDAHMVESGFPSQNVKGLGSAEGNIMLSLKYGSCYLERPFQKWNVELLSAKPNRRCSIAVSVKPHGKTARIATILQEDFSCSTAGSVQPRSVTWGGVRPSCCLQVMDKPASNARWTTASHCSRVLNWWIACKIGAPRTSRQMTFAPCSTSNYVMAK
ncbi:hypothetical protein SCUP515_01085 [Seiridium cupressi]